MKLKLNFDLYKGKTRLREWWKEVKKHFTEVQDAINELDTNITDEAAERDRVDTVIMNNLTDEILARDIAVSNLTEDLQGHLDNPLPIFRLSEHKPFGYYNSSDMELARLYVIENDTDSEFSYFQDYDDYGTALSEPIPAGAKRICVKNKDTVGGAEPEDGYIYILNDDAIRKLDIAAALTAETAARETADNALDERVKPLEAASHTHDNKEILDAIDAERVEKWDGIKEQVTQEQLDAVFEHLYEIAIGHDLELEKVYYAIGLTVYDGGLIGAPISGTLDCGEIDDEISGIIDCGGPEPYIAEIAADSSTIDGGTLDTPSDGSKIIDGGEIK